VKRGLSRIVPWAQELLGEVLNRGDLVVDLTAGNGQDTLALFNFVGDAGQVIAFDIQPGALDNTRSLLEDAGGQVRMIDARRRLECHAGVDLIMDSHEHLGLYVDGAPQGVIANLGYLPGGDQSIITISQSTLPALQQAADILAVGGRMAVTVYPGHLGGNVEADEVSVFFAGLSDASFHVLMLKVTNRPRSPFLFIAEKIK
jgi:SAM-dependent methyltransferase